MAIQMVLNALLYVEIDISQSQMMSHCFDPNPYYFTVRMKLKRLHPAKGIVRALIPISRGV